MTHNMLATAAKGRCETVDAVIVGAGFGGLYMLHQLRKLGLRARVIERGADVGGTWYWNRYPGARCDAASALYSYSFSDEIQQQWSWSQKYATQPEILAYIQFVADKLNLRTDIWFKTQVSGVEYDAAGGRWRVETDQGDEIEARYCILATGCLSAGRLPDLPGLTDTALPTYHTGNWPHQPVDFSGMRVGVIGTGSSGIQAIPEIAKDAAEVVVFQRTPNFVVPAGNAPVNPEEERFIKSNYAAIRQAWREGELLGGGEEIRPGNLYRRPVKAREVSDEERREAYEQRWQTGGAAFNAAFGDIMLDLEANATSANFVRQKIQDIVTDPAVAELLTPTDHPIGAKRICVHDEYYQTFNRTNVLLVDIRKSPIVEIADDGVVTQAGKYPLDALVLATGFDAMTGALLRMNITGRDGLKLADKWANGAAAYLGVAIAGYPNMFVITGPGSPSVLGNVVNHIEQHVEFITTIIERAEREHFAVEASAQSERQWMEHVAEVADGTLFTLANSWYVGANVPGKPRVFLPYVGGIAAFRRVCDAVLDRDLDGFVKHHLDPNGASQLPEA